MSANLDARAEIVKLARLVGQKPERLAYLEKVPPEDIKRLRERTTDVLFDADREKLQRVSAASRRLPAPLVAQIAQRVFGPLLVARLAGLVEPGRAVGVANHLSPAFLADVAVELDPRRVRSVLGHLPIERVVAAARVLVRRGEFVTMGQFVAHLSKEAIEATLAVIDDAALLRIAFVIEDPKRLNDIVGVLPEERFSGVIRAAAAKGLWSEALALVSNVSERRRGALGDLAAQEDDATLEGMVRAVHEQDLWDVLLPVLSAMSEDSRKRFTKLRAVRDRDVLGAIVRSAARNELWRELLPLVPLLPPTAQRHAAAAAAKLERPAFESAVAAAHEHALWDPLLRLAAQMEEEARRDLAEVVLRADEPVLEGFIASAADLDPEGQERLAQTAAALARTKRNGIARRARSLGVFDRLGALREALEQG